MLSEHMLSERKQNIPRPDLSKLVVENRKTYSGSNGYNRYDSWELSPMPLPEVPAATSPTAVSMTGWATLRTFRSATSR